MKTNQPEAWIAVSNNRQKIYSTNNGIDNDKVYLDDKTEFQIELYNPTPYKYLANILLNGKMISNSGIVLKPGQRYFLDRYIDTNNKLVYKTYTVDNNNEAKTAISDNGKIKVLFYMEKTYKPLDLLFRPNTWTFTDHNTLPRYTWASRSASTPGASIGISGTFNCSNSAVNTATAYVNNDITYNANNIGLSFTNTFSDSIETGTIDKGNGSSQSFDADYSEYECFASYKSEYQILPRSAKHIEIGEIRNYCSECGLRIKKQTWKFCPSCGEEIK